MLPVFQKLCCYNALQRNAAYYCGRLMTLDPHYGLRVIPQSKVNQYLQRSRLEQWLALGDYASDYRDIPGMGFWHQSDSDRMSFNFVQMNESNFRVLTSTEVLLLIRQIRWKVKVRWWMLVNKERVRQRTKKLTAFNWTLFETFMCTGRYLSTGLSLLSPVIATVKIEERVVELRQVANRSSQWWSAECRIWMFIGGRRPLRYLGLIWRLLPRQQFTLLPLNLLPPSAR